jgi:hypothetical protein
MTTVHRRISWAGQQVYQLYIYEKMVMVQRDASTKRRERE